MIPSPLYRVGREYFASLASTWPGESDEAYLGIGLVIITVGTSPRVAPIGRSPRRSG